jgi:hypothetical protein
LDQRFLSPIGKVEAPFQFLVAQIGFAHAAVRSVQAPPVFQLAH